MGRSLSEFEAEVINRMGGKAILMLCPNADCNHSIVIPFADQRGKDPEGGPVWKRDSGSTVDNMTLSPSYHLPTSCGLHGWVRNGEWVDC